MDKDKKLSFLVSEYCDILSKLNSDTIPKWGKMTVQHMIEHMSDSVRIANNKVPHDLRTAPENLERMRVFLFSEKAFRENTPNELMPDNLPPARLKSKEKAVKELQKELTDFDNYFKQNPGVEVMNPFFGSLNLEGWTQLLYKHAWHHLKQFGIDEKGN